MNSITSKNQILVVEDDENLRLALVDNLEELGLEVHAADCVAAARSLYAQQAFDIIILDLMLPDGDGYALCRDLRTQDSQVPILMLTARSLEEDLLQGFDAGADDYLTKPFRLKELLARVRAMLRRGRHPAGDPANADPVYALGGCELNLRARVVRDPSGEPVDLTRTEFDLLACLHEHRDTALTRDQILDHVWGNGVLVDYRTVDNFISSLRRKVSDHPASGFAS